MSKTDEQRRRVLKAGGALAVGAGLAGCLGGISTGGDGTNVGMVYATGGLGDNSFNDMAHKGVKEAEDEFDVSYKNAEPDTASEVASLQRKFAKSTNPGYELICCIGFVQKDGLEENAKQFPDKNFTIVDEAVDRDNVASYRFREHEGSFQVGHLAGLLTSRDFSAGGGETNDDLVVGFVGGLEIPLIKKFQAGYEAGVEHANGDVEVLSAYAGDFNDPATGKEIAVSMYDQGADVVYHAAGGTGLGVFRAAKEQSRYAIGVDADQSKSAPEFSDVILASMVKHVDEAVFRSVKNTVNDSFKGGQVNRLGLEEGGVKAVYGTDLGPEIPGDVKSAIEDSRTAIVDGDIEVPTEPSSG